MQLYRKNASLCCTPMGLTCLLQPVFDVMMSSRAATDTVTPDNYPEHHSPRCRHSPSRLRIHPAIPQISKLFSKQLAVL